MPGGVMPEIDAAMRRERLVLAALRGGHDLASILDFVRDAEAFIAAGAALPAMQDAPQAAAAAARQVPAAAMPPELPPYLYDALMLFQRPVSMGEAVRRLRAKPESIKAYRSKLRGMGYSLAPLDDGRQAAAVEPVEASVVVHRAVTYQAPAETELVAKPPEEVDAALEVALGTGVEVPAKAARDFLAGLSNQDGQIVSLRRRGWNAAQLAGRFSLSIPEINAALRRLERDGHLPRDAEAAAAAGPGGEA